MYFYTQIQNIKKYLYLYLYRKENGRKYQI